MPIEYIPVVIIANILSRLEVKSVLRFRCVCKLWCALITDPDFVEMHLTRSLARNSNPNLSLIFRGTYRHTLHSVDLDACEQQSAVNHVFPFKSHDYRLVGSCNGLLCISNINYDLFFWNPFTGKHKKLPNTPTEYPGKFGDKCTNLFIVYGFGYDPTTDDYKVLRIVSDDMYCFDSEVKVYSLITNSWRRIGDMPFQLKHTRSSGVLANSALHWLAKREGGSDFTVVSFDLEDEEHREISPPDFVEPKLVVDVGVLGGQLCLVRNFYQKHIEIWVMKDYGVRDSWMKLFSIEQYSLISLGVKPICYLKNGEVLLEKGSNSLVLYDPRKGTVRNLRIRGVDLLFVETRTCIQTLVPPFNAKR